MFRSGVLLCHTSASFKVPSERLSCNQLFVKTTPDVDMTTSIRRPLPPPPPPRSRPPVQTAWVPEGAILMTPDKIGPKIYYLPDTDQILKVGLRVRMKEAEAMRFVASHTSVPVPHVHDAYVTNGIGRFEDQEVGYIFMSKVEGRPLGDVWAALSDDDRAVVVDQLREHVLQLRELRGRFYGAPGDGPCEDIFFHHLGMFDRDKLQYGPYYSREEYNEGLLQALHNSRPTGSLDDADVDLAQDIMAFDDDCKIFSHGDFHLWNIHVDDSLKVTGIVDWETAGFSINERDYLEAMLRSSGDRTWMQALAEIFPEESQVHYKTFNALNQALVKYSGF